MELKDFGVLLDVCRPISLSCRARAVAAFFQESSPYPTRKPNPAVCIKVKVNPSSLNFSFCFLKWHSCVGSLLLFQTLAPQSLWFFDLAHQMGGSAAAWADGIGGWGGAFCMFLPVLPDKVSLPFKDLHSHVLSIPPPTHENIFCLSDGGVDLAVCRPLVSLIS